MKKTFIGLLIVAAIGAGAFYFLYERTCDKPGALTENPAEQIIGRWKIDSISTVTNDTLQDIDRLGIVLDSTLKKCSYEFQKTGILLKSFPASERKDTLNFEWGKEKELIVKKDSTIFSLTLLTTSKDSLTMRTGTHEVLYFSKLK
jgi:hypothetical protein